MILLPSYIISFIVAFVLCLSDLPSESPELYKVYFHFFKVCFKHAPLCLCISVSVFQNSTVEGYW